MHRPTARHPSTQRPGPRGWFAALGLVFGLLTLATPAAAEFLPVTDPAFKITQARPILDSRTQTFLLDVSVSNTGRTALPGQYRLVVASANKTALEPMGATAANEPFYGLLTGQGAAFAAGATHKRQLKFSGGRGQLVATLRLEREIPAPPPNQPPRADAGAAIAAVVPWDSSTVAVTLDGSGSTDPDGAVVAWRWTGAPDPGDVVNPTLPLAPGSHTFTLVVTDNQGQDSAPATVQITVTQAPPPSPPALTIVPNHNIAEGGTLEIPVSADDPDGGVVTLTAAPPLTNARFDATPGPVATGRLRFSPDYTQQGTHYLTFTARDPEGYTRTAAVRVEVSDTNRAPVLDLPATATVAEGGVLNLPISASDLDGDAVRIAAGALPVNAVFAAAAGVLTFAPDYDQAGEYRVDLTATDGKVTTGPATLTITVTDTQAGTGQARELVLQVAPVGSPTFQATQRVLGTVNAPGGLPPLPSPGAGVITGLVPTSAPQGATLDVQFSGAADGRYATAFVAGESRLEAGAGITVESLTVLASNLAVARIRIDPAANPGPRAPRIVTGGAVAVSVNAFTVEPGSTTITGLIRDPDSGAPVTAGTVALSGTNFEVALGADGRFTLTGMPPGTYQLIVNAPNRRFLSQTVETRIGLPVAVGALDAAATVFDPTSAPSISTLSILGRGLGDPATVLDPARLRGLITEALLLVGGDEAGVRDAYGNQLNPALTGDGLVSVTDTGISALTDALSRGEGLSLQALLYGLSAGFRWTGSGSPDLGEWLAGLRAEVDAAWQDPTAPGNALAVLVFNSGRTLLPQAPVLSPYTRLNALQSHLLLNSLFTYVHLRKNGLLGRLAGTMLAAQTTRYDPTIATDAPELEQILLAQVLPASPPFPSANRPFTRFWRNFFTSKDGVIQGQVQVGMAEAAVSVMLGGMMMSSGSLLGTLAAPTFLAGPAIDEMHAAMINANVALHVPAAPLLTGLDLETQEDGTALVKAAFRRSTGDDPARPGQAFVYDLYRFQGDQVPELAARGRFDGGDDLLLVDPDPPDGTSFYSLRATRYQGVDPDVGGPGGDWWPASFAGAKSVFAFGARRLMSDFSAPRSLYVGPLDFSVTLDGIEVDPDPERDIAYYSDAELGAFYQLIAPGSGVGTRGASRIRFADAGFKASLRDGRLIVQAGLAIDSLGNLYAANPASEDAFGGRLFRFAQPDGARTFTGSINYFSQMLVFARPTLSGPMVIRRAADPVAEDLYIVDNSTMQIKRVPVNQPWDPFRRVGQIWATIPPDEHSAGRAIDMAFDGDGDLYLLDGWRVLRFTDGVPTLDALFEPE